MDSNPMEKSPKIAVGILKNDNVSFHLHGKFSILNKDENWYGACEAYIENDQIVIKSKSLKFSHPEEIILIPDDISSDQFEIKDVVIGINFHWEQNENQRFQGALKLKLVDYKIQIINVLPLENYLISVISSEMSANSSIEFLKAHAVISRSWLLAQIEKQDSLSGSQTSYQPIHETEDSYIRWYDREDHTDFHVCADDHCQRYQGITRAFNTRVIEAVQNTQGLVLTFDGKVCDARFSKSCGGVSEKFENCWEPVSHPYLVPVVDNPEPPKGYDLNLSAEDATVKWISSSPDAFCNTNDKSILSQVLNNYDQITTDFFRWKISYFQKELQSIILEKSGRDYGDIIDLIPLERGESGRIIRLKIVGTKKILIIGKELEIRRTLSKSHLYSSAFLVKKSDFQGEIPGKFEFIGAGWGHGVGLCQIGAAVMGAKGYSYEKILTHYFKGASISSYHHLENKVTRN